MKKNNIIILSCLLLAVICVVGICTYVNSNSESARPNDDVSSVESTNQTESLTTEEQAYLADMDKKLEEKFGISVKDNVTAYMGFTSAEVDGQLKTDVLECFLNDFSQCEIPKELPEVIVGNWAAKIGNKTFTESGYYHYVDDEFVYFKVYTDDSPDDFKLYRVNRNLNQSIAERLFKYLHKTT